MKGRANEERREEKVLRFRSLPATALVGYLLNNKRHSRCRVSVRRGTSTYLYEYDKTSREGMRFEMILLVNFRREAYAKIDVSPHLTTRLFVSPVF